VRRLPSVKAFPRALVLARVALREAGEVAYPVQDDGVASHSLKNALHHAVPGVGLAADEHAGGHR